MRCCFSPYPLQKLNLKLNLSSFFSPFAITITDFITINHLPCSQQICSFSSDPSADSTKVDTLHAYTTKSGSLHNLSASNYLLSLYVKNCQRLSLAQKLFDEIPEGDVRTWTILISGFAQNGLYRKGLELFRRMLIDGVSPNQFTLSSIIKCCSCLYEVRNGKGIHGWMVVNGIGLDVVLENAILDLYVKCGAFDYAMRLFESMDEKDGVSCAIMIGGFLHIGRVDKSLELFQSLSFKDVSSWNTTIDGLMRNGYERVALELLYKMVESGPLFNATTFTTALKLASCLADLELGQQIHGRVLRKSMHGNGFIRNSLLDMYCKCGKTKKAFMIFQKRHTEISYYDSMAETISWSSMVAGYVRNGEYESALEMFGSMVRTNIKVDICTLTSVISACANAGISEHGRQIHSYIQKIGHRVDAHMCSSLIDMYAKCGSLRDAQMIFIHANELNVVTWTSMISAFALHGQGRDAVRLFEQMMNEGIVPNEITFIGVLTACSHAGLVVEGCKYFDMMQKVYGIQPGVEHYTCMVDLYGRAGHLDATKEFIRKNGISHFTAVWKSFLSSCRLHKNVEMGKWVCEKLIHLEPYDAASYILLSNIHANDHSWEEAAKLRSLMQQRKVNRVPGQSWIQLNNQVHSFVMGDRSHPQATDNIVKLGDTGRKIEGNWIPFRFRFSDARCRRTR